jgi:ribulose 1,5-bisphosphate synthetase/thiazole synthase
MGHFARECHSARNDGEIDIIQKVAPVEVIVVVPAAVHALRTLIAQKRTNADTEAIAAIEDVVVRQNPKNVDGVPLRAQE